MFKDFAKFLYKREKKIKDNFFLRSKIDEILAKTLKEEVLKNSDLKYGLSYSVNNGIIKIKTDNKIIAQEIALRINILEKKLKDSGIVFNKLLI